MPALWRGLDLFRTQAVPRASGMDKKSPCLFCAQATCENKDKCIAKAQDEPPDQVEGEGGGSR